MEFRRVLFRSDHKLAAEAAPARAGAGITWTPNLDTSLKEPRATVLIPGARIRYLAEIAEQGGAINAGIEKQAEAADRAQACWQALQELGDDKLPKQLDLYGNEALLPPAGEEARKAEGALDPALLPPAGEGARRADEGALRSDKNTPDRSLLTLRQRYNDAIQSLTSENLKLLRDWPTRLKSITDDTTAYEVRGKQIKVDNYRESLSHQKVPKIAAPTYKSWGELLTFLGKENLPGSYPSTEIGRAHV